MFLRRSDVCVLFRSLAAATAKSAEGEGMAVLEKMYTFVSGKKSIESIDYAEFMSTFVYLPRNAVSSKVK